MTVDNSGILPQSFPDADTLDEFMSTPPAALVRELTTIPGDIAIIGVGGKMGPTLARMAKRADPERRVVGVARFTDSALPDRLRSWGVEPIRCDLLDRSAVASLPDAANVIFMAGRKFGSVGAEDLTWAMNAYVPALVAERYAGSRIVCYSTICVYPFVSVLSGGASEDHPPDPPGEYAMSCLARERIIRHFSAVHRTPGAIVRLSYAIDMRYGVLHDIGQKILHGEPIDLAMGHVNVIWQGDAVAQSLRLLARCEIPSPPFNISGPETASVRMLALGLGERLGREPVFIGSEADTAWLANTSLATGVFGYPSVPINRLLDWTADWLANDRGSLGKETHFDVRSGAY